MKIANAAVVLYTAGFALPALASGGHERDANARNVREITATYELNDAQIVIPGLKGVASARKEYGLGETPIESAAAKPDQQSGSGSVSAAPRR